MSVLSRFFGRGKKQPTPQRSDDKPVSKEGQQGAALQVVFSGSLNVPAAALAQRLQQFDASTREAKCEFQPGLDLLGFVEWGGHGVRMFGVNAPFPKQHLEMCVAPAHYAQELKETIRRADSHVLLWYAGDGDTPMRTQYAVLAMIAEALADFGAVGTLNELGHTSLPSGFLKSAPSDQIWGLLQSLPLTMLYCGFVKYEVEGTKGVWMRTYGAQKFGLPDFAVLAEGHHEGGHYSDLINNIWDYMLQSGAQMAAGHTMQIGEGNYLKLRDPTSQEYFLHGPDKVLVASIIGSGEINRPSASQ